VYSLVEKNSSQVSTKIEPQQVDWERVNLDEWIAIIQASGQLPDASTMTILDGDRQQPRYRRFASQRAAAHTGTARRYWCGCH